MKVICFQSVFMIFLQYRFTNLLSMLIEILNPIMSRPPPPIIPLTVKTFLCSDWDNWFKQKMEFSAKVMQCSMGHTAQDL